MANIIDKKWSGVWWLYSATKQDSTRVHGTLSFIDDGCMELELCPAPYESFLSCDFEHNYTIWGIDKYGTAITMFFATPSFATGSQIEKLTSKCVLIGAHISSMDEAFFTEARIHYPYLKNIFFKNRIDASFLGSDLSISTNVQESRTAYTIPVENDTNWVLFSSYSWNIKPRLQDIHLSQDTYFSVVCTCEKSLNYFFRHVDEFSAFLSLSLYSRQSPNEICFYKNSENPKYTLYFNTQTSANSSCRLISDDIHSTRIEDILKNWHTQYEQVIPIWKYIERSKDIHKGIGDIAEFLLVEFAIEGYFKRFHNKKKTRSGKDLRQPEHGIAALLKYYSKVELINKLHLNIKSVIDTRDSYAHLLPDAERAAKKIIESPRDIWIATEKMRILLLCCLLNNMGFSIEEINNRFKEAPVLLPEAFTFNTPWIDN